MVEHVLNRIDINTDKPEVALGRLELITGRIAERRGALRAEAAQKGVSIQTLSYSGPATEVHVWGDLALALEHGAVRDALAYIARHGEQCGAVILIHGDLADIAKKIHVSRFLAVALAAGKVVRHAPGPTAPSWSAVPITPEESEYYSETLSAEMWALLMMGNAQALIKLFRDLWATGEGAAGPTARHLLSDALRRSADIVLPGAGGMLHGAIPCPLCIASPMIRVDEVPGHLISQHNPTEQSRLAGIMSSIMTGNPDAVANAVRELVSNDQDARYRIADTLSRAAIELRYDTVPS